MQAISPRRQPCRQRPMSSWWLPLSSNATRAKEVQATLSDKVSSCENFPVCISHCVTFDDCESVVPQTDVCADTASHANQTMSLGVPSEEAVQLMLWLHRHWYPLSHI